MTACPVAGDPIGMRRDVRAMDANGLAHFMHKGELSLHRESLDCPCGPRLARRVTWTGVRVPIVIHRSLRDKAVRRVGEGGDEE